MQKSIYINFEKKIINRNNLFKAFCHFFFFLIFNYRHFDYQHALKWSKCICCKLVQLQLTTIKLFIHCVTSVWVIVNNFLKPIYTADANLCISQCKEAYFFRAQPKQHHISIFMYSTTITKYIERILIMKNNVMKSISSITRILMTFQYVFLTSAVE